MKKIPAFNSENKKRLYLFGIFLVATLISFLIALVISMRVEFETQRTVDKAIPVGDMGWVRVEIDGARVRIFGNAPDDEARFRVGEAISTDINVSRIDNEITAPEVEMEEPELSVEIVQNPRMSSIIGLLPREPSPVPIFYALDRANPGITTLNMVENLETPVDESWEDKVDFIASIINDLPNVKISATEDQLRVETVVPDNQAAQELKSKIQSRTPDNYEVILDISVPRELIVPFVFSEETQNGKTEIIECSATNEANVARIQAAFSTAEAVEFEKCALGLGAPTAEWGLLIEQLQEEISDLESHALYVRDNQVQLNYPETEDEGKISRIESRIRSILPPGFGLETQRIVQVRSIEELEAEGDSVALFLQKEIDGGVMLDGVVGSEAMKTNVESIAAAKFGSSNLKEELKIVDGLPAAWEKYVFAAINSVGEMNEGEATLTEGFYAIKGTVESDEKRQKLIDGLQRELGGLTLQHEITVSKEVAEAATSNPDECVENMSTVLVENPIVFEPSSSRISEESTKTIVEVSQLLYECRAHSFEIGGHTDSQGSEEVNLRISQERATSVLEAIMSQTLDYGPLSAKGYGETQPVASNDTEEGRAKNRRIEIELNLAPAETPGE